MKRGRTNKSLQAQQHVMELVIEDATPLFDVTSSMQTFLPNGSEEEHVGAAQVLVRDLLQRGHVVLVYDCLANASAGRRHIEPLTAAETRTESADRANWLYHERRDPDQRWVTMVATPAGERALLAGEFSAR